MTDTVAAQTSALDNALAAYESSKAKLHHEDGRPIYANDLHQQKLDELMDQLDGIVAKAHETAQQAIDAASGELELVGADPMSSLSTDQLARANQLMGLVREDYQDASNDELVKRAKAALASKDPVVIALNLRYGERRVESLRRLIAAGSSTPLQQLGFGELDQAIKALKATQGHEQRRAALQAKIDQAQDLRIHATRTRAAADGSRAAAGNIRRYW